MWLGKFLLTEIYIYIISTINAKEILKPSHSQGLLSRACHLTKAALSVTQCHLSVITLSSENHCNIKGLYSLFYMRTPKFWS